MFKLFLIFSIFVISKSFSQSIVPDTSINNKTNKTVLVIPFSPRLYYNDADKEIAKQTGNSFEQIMNSFRIGYDNSLIKQLNDTCKAISILSGYTISNNDDIENVYSNSNYVFEKAMGLDKKKPSGYTHSQLMVSDKKAEKERKKANKGEVVSPVTDVTNKFMHVKFNSPAFLIELSRKNTTDYLLFINQFEIIGNYLNPYKTGSNTNNMLIKVHYSLYDSQGKYLFGSFATEEYPSTITDLKTISAQFFKAVNTQIISNIPLASVTKKSKRK
ncbi:MAG: hypothetical protein A2046_03905 [Bacteroidetes bacterium GWA2_30_7]|nr:MAG: hypothetical protein A2046_03905 [Bacteroidetes bacterium GWA2_30_7]